MAFQIGEKVVYPNQGIGTIENIRPFSLGDQYETCYLLRMAYGSVTVPLSKVANIGLRPITNSHEITRILDFLANGPCHLRADWKIRLKENSLKLQSGSLLDAAEVMKALLLQQREKQLSFSEKRLLERSRRMLVGEISIARRIGEAEAAVLLQKYLGKAALSLPAVL
jgi:CarD family transcriptional regulator